MQISVYGSGYLGSVISACIADFGLPVTCYDENSERIREIAGIAVEQQIGVRIIPGVEDIDSRLTDFLRDQADAVVDLDLVDVGAEREIVQWISRDPLDGDKVRIIREAFLPTKWEGIWKKGWAALQASWTRRSKVGG